jgi:DNA-binding response OmpR family regulator
MATILLVEDEQSLCELYATILRSEGHEVFVTHDGKSAVEAARGHRPDLVIMDICLPEKMDGIESMSKILGEDKTIPVIINTGYTQYRDNFMTWAAEAYVVKSADTGPLLEAVREVLARKGRK